LSCIEKAREHHFAFGQHAFFNKLSGIFWLPKLVFPPHARFKQKIDKAAILSPNRTKTRSLRPGSKADLPLGATTDQLLLQKNLWGILNSITEGILVVNQGLVVTQLNKRSLRHYRFSI